MLIVTSQWPLLAASLCACYLFSVCRVLSKSGFRYARANKTKQVSPELPCQLSGELSPWSSARICGWADRTLVVLIIPKPSCCCFLWGARLPSKLLLGEVVQPSNYVWLEEEERSPKEWLSLGTGSRRSVEIWVWEMIPCRP